MTNELNTNEARMKKKNENNLARKNVHRTQRKNTNINKEEQNELNWQGVLKALEPIAQEIFCKKEKEA